jgi:hypothetical protein
MKRKLTMQDLRKVAKDFNLEVYDSREEICIYTPKGYHFAGTGTHVLCSTYRGVKEWKPEAIADLLDDLKYGVERCKKDCVCMED